MTIDAASQFATVYAVKLFRRQLKYGLLEDLNVL